MITKTLWGNGTWTNSFRYCFSIIQFLYVYSIFKLRKLCLLDILHLKMFTYNQRIWMDIICIQIGLKNDFSLQIEINVLWIFVNFLWIIPSPCWLKFSLATEMLKTSKRVLDCNVNLLILLLGLLGAAVDETLKNIKRNQYPG